MAYTSFVSGPVTFGFTPAEPPTKGRQSDRLRGLAFDSLATELDNMAEQASRSAADLTDLSNRSRRAATQLRQLRKLREARTANGKRRTR
jgi:hypothetical protein